MRALLPLLLLLAPCWGVPADLGVCSDKALPIHLTGEVRNSSVVPSPAACCEACGRLEACMGFSFCAGPGPCVDGNDTYTPVTWPPGSCLLKSWWRPSGWPTSDGCGGAPGQPWRSGMNPNYYATFAYYPPPCEKGSKDAGLPGGAVPGVPGGAVGALWAGAVVALDLDSWSLNQAGPAGSPPVLTAFQCAYECETRYGGAGANAFAFCEAADGCGAGCAAAAAHAAPVTAGRDTKVVGPFSKKGCAEVAGAATDRWAFQLCRCLRVKDTRRPAAVPAGEGGGAGWVSGPTVKRPVY